MGLGGPKSVAMGLGGVVAHPDKSKKEMEAGVGIEPASTALQAAA